MAGGQREAQSLGGTETDSVWGKGVSSQLKTHHLTKEEKFSAADE